MPERFDSLISSSHSNPPSVSKNTITRKKTNGLCFIQTVTLLCSDEMLDRLENQLNVNLVPIRKFLGGFFLPCNAGQKSTPRNNFRINSLLPQVATFALDPTPRPPSLTLKGAARREGGANPKIWGFCPVSQGKNPGKVLLPSPSGEGQGERLESNPEGSNLS